MSEGRSRDATAYHERLATALSHASEADKNRVLTRQDVWAIYQRYHGKKERKELDYILASDHCDRTTPRAKKGSGRCLICTGGEFLLERVSNSGKYRMPKTQNTAPYVISHLVEDDSQTYEEGKRFLRQHLTIERSAQLVADKKAQVLYSEKALICEICSFDFAVVYGPLGEGFAECHHTTPLAQVQDVRTSRIEDLVVVCANCHRMLHRPPHYSVGELRTILQSRRKPTT